MHSHIFETKKKQNKTNTFHPIISTCVSKRLNKANYINSCYLNKKRTSKHANIYRRLKSNIHSKQ